MIIPNSITPPSLTFWEELVITLSMIAVLLVKLVGIDVSCSTKKEKQKSR